jgi:menaquinone-dependent protoporphyrinogen oxidase
MDSTILVAYASTHGSTQEVAERVTTTLREHGLTADLQPAQQVRSLAGYSAVVLGAPLYMFRLHKHALRFLGRHQKAFQDGKPIAIFAGGPFSTGKESAAELENSWGEARKQLDQELSKFPWLAPLSVEVIGGRFNPSALRFPWSLLPAMRQLPASDLRDWEAIRRWAAELAAQLQSLLEK